LAFWWLGLHTLLAASALLMGWPWLAKSAAIAALVAHAAWRRPQPAHGVIEVDADGACRIPGVSAVPFTPGTRTRLAPYWLRIAAPGGSGPLDILLLADQLDPRDWRRLTAILRRATAS
jgi:hypothetical protein